MPSLFALPSWIEVHGAVTHFPIALLIVAAAAEFLALFLKEREEQRTFCRQGGLVLLALAVISAPPAILSGYLYGRNLRRPPLEYDLHWKMAVVSTALGALVLVWRLAARDRLNAGLRAAATFGLLAAALAVGYTGKLGGQMVFGGDEDAAAAVPLPSPTPDVAAQVAGKMEDASRHLDLAADKMLLATGERNAKRAAQAAQAAQTAQRTATAAAVRSEAAANHAGGQVLGQPGGQPVIPPAVVVTAPNNGAARLEKVVSRFEAAADKLDRAAARLSANPPVAGGQYAPLTPLPTAGAPAPGSAPTKTGGDKTAATSNTQLLSEGMTLVKSDDMGCMGCHKLAGVGGKGGPALDGTGSRHPDADWQFHHLQHPKSVVPNSRMPDYDWNDAENASMHLTPEKLRAMAAYLATLK